MSRRNLPFKGAKQACHNTPYAKIAENNRFAILKNDIIFPELPSILPLVELS